MRKVYNEEKVSHCPFCGSAATAKNEQKLPVCIKHKGILLQDLKCACGEWLDLKEGKYGPFFVCFNCKIVSFKKGLDMNGYPLKSVEDL
ncbi:MAG: hypothetical protein WC758_03185 [Candidatus Woesearchaeota archaeon]|jgi:hypothetical protein